MVALAHYSPNVLLDSTTSAIKKGASVLVYLADGVTVATLYSSAAGAAKANPLTTDATTGDFDFFAADGPGYTFKVDGAFILDGAVKRIFSVVAAKHTVNPCNAPWLAKGDGVADDTAAIQAAIASLPTTGANNYGGIVELPAGTFLISADLTLPNGVRLKGQGPAATIVRAKSSTAFSQAMIRNADASGSQEFAWVSDLYVQANKAGAAVVPVGILFDTVFVNSSIQNVIVSDTSGIGIQVKCLNAAPGVQNSGPILINDVWTARTDGHGIEILGQVNTSWLSNITVENMPAGKAGIHIKGPLTLGIVGGFTTSTGHSIRNVHFEASAATTYAVWLEDSAYATVESVEASAATATSVMVRITGTLVDDSAHSVNIMAKNITAGGGVAIDDVTRGVTISGFCAHYETNKILTHAGLGVGNSAAATTLGSVVKKIQVFDATGTSLGYLPVYNTIT